MTTSLMLPVWSEQALSEALREHGLPGQRSRTAILRIRRERARRAATATIPSLRQRADARLLARYGAEIRARGGLTELRTHKNTYQTLAVVDRRDGMCLLAVHGWRYYTARESHRASLVYLCGSDDNGPWAHRVPGTIERVSDGLAWITPSAVTDARRKGMRVRRQGDVWAIEVGPRAAADTDRDTVIADSHEWRAATHTLIHRPGRGRRHAPVRVAFRARFVAARQLPQGMGD